jgi:hypothetical protein
VTPRDTASGPGSAGVLTDGVLYATDVLCGHKFALENVGQTRKEVNVTQTEEDVSFPIRFFQVDSYFCFCCRLREGTKLAPINILKIDGEVHPAGPSLSNSSTLSLEDSRMLSRKISTPRILRSFPADPFVRTVSPPTSPSGSPTSPKEIDFGIGGRLVNDAVGFRRCYGADAGGGSHLYQQTTFLETINQLPAATGGRESPFYKGGWTSQGCDASSATSFMSPQHTDPDFVPRVLERPITPPRTALACPSPRQNVPIYPHTKYPAPAATSPRGGVPVRSTQLAPLLNATWPRTGTFGGGGGGGGGGGFDGSLLKSTQVTRPRDIPPIVT